MRLARFVERQVKAVAGKKPCQPAGRHDHLHVEHGRIDDSHQLFTPFDELVLLHGKLGHPAGKRRNDLAAGNLDLGRLESGPGLDHFRLGDGQFHDAGGAELVQPPIDLGRFLGDPEPGAGAGETSHFLVATEFNKEVAFVEGNSLADFQALNGAVHFRRQGGVTPGHDMGAQGARHGGRIIPRLRDLRGIGEGGEGHDQKQAKGEASFP